MSLDPRTRAAMTRWLHERRRFVAARLVQALGSAPMGIGAAMLIDEDGAIEGSVTGGCIESALVAEARRVFAGEPPRMRQFGVSDELAGAAGLMCGGTVEVFVAEIVAAQRHTWSLALAAAGEDRPVALATLLDGPGAGETVAVVADRVIGGLGGRRRLEAAVVRDSHGLLAGGATAMRRYAADGSSTGDDLRVFVQTFARAPRMVIVGAIDFAAALAEHASRLGYRVTICDPRRAFAASGRFSSAAEVVAEWPHECLGRLALGPRDAVLVFTHDPKFDEPALIAALEGDAGYVGALGSRRTHRARLDRLHAAGVPEEQLTRIVSPCGLDIGGATPDETAVSILAELVVLRSGRGAGRLVDGAGPIHDAPRDLAPAVVAAGA